MRSRNGNETKRNAMQAKTFCSNERKDAGHALHVANCLRRCCVVSFREVVPKTVARQLPMNEHANLTARGKMPVAEGLSE